MPEALEEMGAEAIMYSRSSKTALMIGPPGPQLALGESVCFFLKKPNISRPSQVTAQGCDAGHLLP